MNIIVRLSLSTKFSPFESNQVIPWPSFSGWFSFGPHVFLDQRVQFFLRFRDGNIRVRAQAVEEDHRVENFAAYYTMPSEKGILLAVEFFKGHSPLASSAADIFFHICGCSVHVSFLLSTPEYGDLESCPSFGKFL